MADDTAEFVKYCVLIGLLYLNISTSTSVVLSRGHILVAFEKE